MEECGQSQILASSCKECNEKEEEFTITPFEWVTNFSSLSKILNPSSLLHHDHSGKVLHIGCGSSILGELMEQTWNEYQSIINIDIDTEVIEGMKKRYSRRKPYSSVCDWSYFDFNTYGQCMEAMQKKRETKQMSTIVETFNFMSGDFDLVVDKSTLDCALCSDDATSGLICLAHDSLSKNGVYVCVTFHHQDFIRPLLQDCPGVQWSVECIAVEREVDDLNALSDGKSWDDTQRVHMPGHDLIENSAWINGKFSPSAKYGRSCNVFVCRRSAESTNDCLLNREAVRKHIWSTNDTWFQTQNPMMTHMRRDDLKVLFDEKINFLLPGVDFSVAMLPLKECYNILFTAEEKEHYSYAYFLEDWEAFCEESPTSRSHEMNYETALEFLSAMQ